jgi:hypothetical protein
MAEYMTLKIVRSISKDSAAVETDAHCSEHIGELWPDADGAMLRLLFSSSSQG